MNTYDQSIRNYNLVTDYRNAYRDLLRLKLQTEKAIKDKLPPKPDRIFYFIRDGDKTNFYSVDVIDQLVFFDFTYLPHPSRHESLSAVFREECLDVPSPVQLSDLLKEYSLLNKILKDSETEAPHVLQENYSHLVLSSKPNPSIALPIQPITFPYSHIGIDIFLSIDDAIKTRDYICAISLTLQPSIADLLNSKPVQPPSP